MTDDQLDLIFKAISDSTRRRIIDYLSKQPAQSLFEVCAASVAGGWRRFVPSDGFPASGCSGESWVDQDHMEGTDESPFIDRQRRSYRGCIVAPEIQTERRENMKIYVTNVFVDNQEKAEKFYTDVLGFTVKKQYPLGGKSLADSCVERRPQGNRVAA